MLKMASVKSLEDMLLSSDIDESALNALVGSLESQLSSACVGFSRADSSSTSVISNHISSTTTLDCNSRIPDGHKHGAQILGSLLEHGNSGQNPNKTLTPSHLLTMGAMPSPGLSSAVMVPVSGAALPASGYISASQVSSNQQAMMNSVVRRHVSSSADIRLVYSPHSSNVHFSTAPNSTIVNSGVITSAHMARNNVKMTSLSNGNPIVAVNTSGQALPAVSSSIPIVSCAPGQVQTSGTTLSAIHNLADIASQQPHIIIPGTHQGAIRTPHNHLQQQLNALNSNKSIMSPRILSKEQMESSLGLKPHQVILKDGQISQVHIQENGNVQNIGVDRSHVSSTSVSHNNSNYQLLSSMPSPSASTKPCQTTQIPGQPINVVSHVMANQSIVPAVQIVNVNSPRLSTPPVQGQKALAPRVVIGSPLRIAPQMIAARPGAPIQNAAFAFPPGMRGTFFVKTENGQFQLVNVSPGVHPTSSASTGPGTATFRVQSVQPGTPSNMRSLVPQQLSVTVPVTSVASGKAIYHNAPGPPANTVVNTSILHPTAPKGPPAPANTTTRNSSPLLAPSQNATVKMSPNTVKKKCKSFLSTLIKLAGEQPEQIAVNVKSLIQGLIDDTVTPEDFTTQLQKELNSSPQPCLIPFLKKSLPYLRHSLLCKEMTIEGINPPPLDAYILPPQTMSSASQPDQMKLSFVQSSVSAVRMVNSVTGSALTAQLSQPPVSTIAAHQRLVAPCVSPIVLSQINSSSAITPQLPPSSITTSVTRGTLNSLSTAANKKVISISATSSISSEEKEKRIFSSVSRDEDDINDVAAMGGVNLIEESQRILLSNSELIGSQIRSCKDENLLLSGPLQGRIMKIAVSCGLGEVANDAVALISHAAEAKLRDLVEKLGATAEHRLESIKADAMYEVSQDVKSQIKFLEELDRLEKKRHEEQEREILLRAAKSRSKLEDPEQLKLKQKAKEMQRAEIEELRQREANMTALLAIGPRKKQKTDLNSSGPSQQNGSNSSSTGSSSINKPQARPRVKRVNLRDLLLVMEQERDSILKPLLFKSYVK